jgi:tetratricopeptide (TPR) repeat protein/anti-sigma regulatory factor (Ser/Thr protein kinase)
MKLLTIAFLFFCSFLSRAFEMKSQVSDQITDSLTYYYYIANNPKTSDEHPKAYRFYNNLKQQNLKQGDTLQAVNNLRQIAIMQNNWGDYYSSEASVVEALELMESFKIKDSIALEIMNGLYNQIGRINHALLKYDTSISYYEKALQIATKQNQKDASKNNMALVLRDKGNYAQSEAMFLEVYNSYLASSDSLHIARALNNLAKVRSKINHPEALNNLMKALDIRLRHNDVIGSYSSYKNLASHYRDRNNNKKALTYANEALRVAKEIKQASFLEDALSLVIGLSEDANIIAYKHLKDSLDTAKQIQENKNALLKYNVEAEQKKVHEGELQKEKAERKTLLTQGLLVFIVLLSVLLYVMVRTRHKKEKLQEVYITEARISKKVHDEVANDVYHVMAKVQSKSGVVGEDVIDDLEHIYNKTRDISKEHGIIDLGSHFEETIKDLLYSYKNDQVSVMTKGLQTISWDAISEIQKTTIYRVLQELMTNMKKHSAASVVMISFSQNNTGIHLIYKDNGKGCVLKKQTGLQNTESRMASINGSIRFESDINDGFKAILRI